MDNSELYGERGGEGESNSPETAIEILNYIEASIIELGNIELVIPALRCGFEFIFKVLNELDPGDYRAEEEVMNSDVLHLSNYNGLKRGLVVYSLLQRLVKSNLNIYHKFGYSYLPANLVERYYAISTIIESLVLKNPSFGVFEGVLDQRVEIRIDRITNDFRKYCNSRGIQMHPVNFPFEGGSLGLNIPVTQSTHYVYPLEDSSYAGILSELNIVEISQQLVNHLLVSCNFGREGSRELLELPISVQNHMFTRIRRAYHDSSRRLQTYERFMSVYRYNKMSESQRRQFIIEQLGKAHKDTDQNYELQTAILIGSDQAIDFSNGSMDVTIDLRDMRILECKNVDLGALDLTEFLFQRLFEIYDFVAHYKGLGINPTLLSREFNLMYALLSFDGDVYGEFHSRLAQKVFVDGPEVYQRILQDIMTITHHFDFQLTAHKADQYSISS